jgi:antirestriction protein ArdC
MVFGLPVGKSLENHAAYLNHWLAAIRQDSRFLFRATTQASKAADYLLSFSRAEQPQNETALSA